MAFNTCPELYPVAGDPLMEMALNILKRVRSDGPLVLVRRTKWLNGDMEPSEVRTYMPSNDSVSMRYSAGACMVTWYSFEKRLKFDTYSPEKYPESVDRTSEGDTPDCSHLAASISTQYCG